MRAEHTQLQCDRGAITPKALVNSLFHKVVNSTSTKKMNDPIAAQRVGDARLHHERRPEKTMPGTSPGIANIKSDKTGRYAWLEISLPSAACAAARRAIGTRYGEQDT